MYKKTINSAQIVFTQQQVFLSPVPGGTPALHIFQLFLI